MAVGTAVGQLHLTGVISVAGEVWIPYLDL